ncbi:SNF1-interacting protein [Cryptotrichosporon argae]
MGNASSHPSSSAAPATSPLASDSRSAAPSMPSAIPARSPPPSSTPAGTLSTPGAVHSGLTPPPGPSSPPVPSTPLLMPHAGHLSPQNPHALSHPQAHDYSKSTVIALILDNQLAPFYRGLEDYDDDWTEDDVGRVLADIREKDYADHVANSYTAKLKDEREGGAGTVGSVTKKIGIHKAREAKEKEDKEERIRREKKAYLGSIECPICFLCYPPNINTSRCCQQPLCTECFVQIRRGEPTLTHLESEAACCPFCMETDFGVIYERPSPVAPATTSSGSHTPHSVPSDVALATSPDASGFSAALSLGDADADAELSIGPGMPPKQQEKARRKSVSSKAPEVVTIDQIRPDWEAKLNAVKAAAARKASRRIVMRQVGDRLIPIGYTSSRAGVADFSMSTGSSDNESSQGGSRRRSRRQSHQDELEQAMIAEAMRASIASHEAETAKRHEDARRPSQSAGAGPSILASTPTSPLGGSFSRSPPSPAETKSSTASKLLSKLSPGRSRAGSRSSVTFAAPPPARTPTTAAAGRVSSSSPPSTGTSTPTSEARARSASMSVFAPAPPSSTTSTDGLAPALPATASANTTSIPAPASNGLPRLSLDMPALMPEPARKPEAATREHATPVSAMAGASPGAAYAQLESDGE